MTAATSNSSTSLIAIGEDLVGEGAVGGGGADRDVAAGPVRLPVDRAGDGHDARVGVDGKASAGVVLQAVGDRVGGRIGVAGGGGDPDDRAVGRVFVHRVGRGVGVGDRADSNSSTSLMVIGEDRSVNEPSAEVARTVMLRLAPSASRSMRAGDGHDARVGVDGEPPAGVVGQTVGDRVGRGVGVAGRGRDAHAVPLAAFSFTALAVALVSLTAPTRTRRRR